MAKITPCLENGKTAFVDILDENEIAFGSSEFIVLRAIKNISDANYIYYLARSPKFRNRAIGCMEGTSGRKRVNDKSLQNETFEIPNIQTQTAIARVLSSFDDKIELNNKINNELENLAKTIYEYWFVQNADKRWEKGKLGDYIPSSGGFAFKSTEWKNEGFPVIKIKDIQEDNTLNFHGIDKVSKETVIDKKFVANAGEVVIAMTGATIGKVAIIPFSEDKILVNQRVGIFKSTDPLEKIPFLINTLNQSYVREMIISIANGASQPNISNEQINAIPLVMPNERLISQYNNMLQPFYTQILKNRQENAALPNFETSCFHF